MNTKATQQSKFHCVDMRDPLDKAMDWAHSLAYWSLIVLFWIGVCFVLEMVFFR